MALVLQARVGAAVHCALADYAAHCLCGSSLTPYPLAENAHAAELVETT